MLTYQLQVRHFKNAKTWQFPGEVEIAIQFQPPEPFGAGHGYSKAMKGVIDRLKGGQSGGAGDPS